VTSKALKNKSKLSASSDIRESIDGNKMIHSLYQSKMQ